jgi:hypothetical protein
MSAARVPKGGYPLDGAHAAGRVGSICAILAIGWPGGSARGCWAATHVYLWQVLDGARTPSSLLTGALWKHSAYYGGRREMGDVSRAAG